MMWGKELVVVVDVERAYKSILRLRGNFTESLCCMLCIFFADAWDGREKGSRSGSERINYFFVVFPLFFFLLLTPSLDVPAGILDSLSLSRLLDVESAMRLFMILLFSFIAMMLRFSSDSMRIIHFVELRHYYSCQVFFLTRLLSLQQTSSFFEQDDDPSRCSLGLVSSRSPHASTYRSWWFPRQLHLMLIVVD